MENRIKALAQHLEIEESEIVESYENNFETSEGEFMVLTDSEADEMNDERLDQYIEDCILPEIPEAYQRYFDEEAFKKDCSYDGRGFNLSGYDGVEHEVTIEGETFYIYRTN